jgi:putative membrane protein
VNYLIWLLKAAIFFTLFAFALNNQQIVSVYFFFGTVWKAPLVLVVLATFACGLALGVFVMMPRWWRNRSPAATGLPPSPSQAASGHDGSPPIQPDISDIPRHGL